MYFRVVWDVLVQLAPWVLLGTLIAGLVHVMLPSGFVRRRLRGPGGVLKAVAIGVPLPLCSCGVIPAGIGLKKDGASDGACIGFLISTPQTGVDSILVSGSFFGWPFALFKVAVAAVTGAVGGWLVDASAGQRTEEDEPLPSTDPTAAGRGGVRELLLHGLEIIRSIWLWLVLGVLVSAGISVFIPPAFLSGLGSLGILPSAFAALVISIPLYVCATASVPIAAALVAGGLPAGAALVFLIAGPGTNVATIGAVYRRFGGRVLAIYLGTIVAGSVLGAVAFDSLIPAAGAHAVAHEHHTHSWWAQGSAAVLLGLFAWFAVDGVNRWWRRASQRVSPSPEVKVPVQGMRCANCVAHVERALRKLAGVESCAVRLEPGEAIVRGSVDETAIRHAIRDAGYQTD